MVVVLPAVQAEFGVARADASLPYTMTMLGSGIGGILMGRLADRFGVMVPVLIGIVGLSIGFVLAALSPSLWPFALAQGVMIGLLGSSATFAPLVADTSLWFVRRRGIAVAICAAGNYVAGAVWPPIVQHFVESVGWRQTYIGIGAFCLVTMLPLALRLRQRPPGLAPIAAAARVGARGLPPNRGRWGCRPTACSGCYAWRASPAAWPCRCRRSTSWPTAATWATVRRAARKCCR